MTIGERISQKRKELGLSQEALGEKLGISRQAIYKWESDSALPEIDKLVALSKLYGVSVGWLLGVEDTPAQAANSDELTEKELVAVEEIVSRYLEATREHKDESKEQVRVWEEERTRFKRGMFTVFLSLFCVGLAVAVGLLWNKVNTQGDETMKYISDWGYDLNMDIIRMKQSMEEMIRQQGSVLSEYTCEVAGADIRANTVTFTLSASPKVWTEDLIAQFVVEDGKGGRYESERLAYENGRFCGEVTAELTDNMKVSVILIQTDGTQTLQEMENYEGLYVASFPHYSFMLRDSYMETQTIDKRTSEVKNAFTMKLNEFGDGVIYSQFLELMPERSDLADISELANVTIENIQVGLFQNGELVEWANPVYNRHGEKQGWGDIEFADVELPMTDGDFVHAVCFIRDNYGRVIASATALTRDVKCEAPYPSGWKREMTPLDIWTYPHEADGFPKI